MNKFAKKSLVSALAVCAVTATGSALAEVGPFNIYGTVEARTVDRDGTDLDSFLDAARLGVKQTVKLNKFEDLRVRYQIEFDLPVNGSAATDSTDSGDVSIRKAQINLLGGFGEVIIGRQNNLMAQAKKIDQFKNDSGAFVLGPDRIGNAISYVSPSFGPVNGFVQVISDVNADQTTTTDDADGSTVGLSVVGDMYDLQASYYDVSEDFDSGKVELTSLGGSVSLGSLGLFATYQSEDVSNVDVWGAGLSYSVNDTTLKLGYSTTDNDAGLEGSYVQLLADYDMGEGVSAFVQYIEYDSEAETTLEKADALSVGIAYNFGLDI